MVSTLSTRQRFWLRFDGGFLIVAGAAALVLETLAHFFNLGPQRGVFGNRPWATIGFFEAHGLAIVPGAVLLSAARAPQRGAHSLAVCVHLVLGGANVLFWSDSFVQLHLEPVGLVTTAFHVLFALVQALLVVRHSSGVHPPGDMWTFADLRRTRVPEKAG